MTTDEQIEAAYATWDGRINIYRAAIGGWVIQLGDHHSPARQTSHGETLTEAIAKAAELKPLPIIPRRPEMGELAHLEPRKSGKWWTMWDPVRQREFRCTTKTKRESLEAIERFKTNALRSQEAWDAEYGQLVSTGEPGVNFYYRTT